LASERPLGFGALALLILKPKRNRI